MRKMAFVIFVIGIFLMFILTNLSPKEIKNAEDLEFLELNTRIVVSGEVVSERIIYDGTRLLELDNNVMVLCECDRGFKGKDIRVIGKVSDYDGKKQVIAEEVLF
jgi:hypothetical protein